MSGLCQPEFVLDIPGGHGKAPAGPNYLSPDHAFSESNSFSEPDSFSEQREPDAETRYRVVDYCGDVHLYPPQP